MATIQELITLANKLVRNRKIDKLDISKLSYQELKALLGNDVPEKIKLNSIGQDASNQKESLLKIKIFVLYNLLQQKKNQTYYSQIDQLITELKTQPAAAIKQLELQMFQELLNNANTIYSDGIGSNSIKTIEQIFSQTPQAKDQPQQIVEHKQQSLDFLRIKHLTLQKRPDRHPMLFSPDKDKEAISNHIRGKKEDLKPDNIQHTQLQTPAQKIAEQKRQQELARRKARADLVMQPGKQPIKPAAFMVQGLGLQQNHLQHKPIPLKSYNDAPKKYQDPRAILANKTLKNTQLHQLLISAQQRKKELERSKARAEIDNQKTSQSQLRELGKEMHHAKEPAIAQSFKYFSPAQEQEIRKYFDHHKDGVSKIKRSLTKSVSGKWETRLPLSEEYPIANLKYSVIKADTGELFVVTDKIIGAGGFSVVKIAESLDNPGNIVALKIQGSTKHNTAYRDKLRDPSRKGYSLIPDKEANEREEIILKKLGKFMGHASNKFKCKLNYKLGSYDKLYTFMELEKGKTLWSCFAENRNNLQTDQQAQSKFFLAMLQATKKLHDMNIIHGDLNPNNFMVDVQNNVFPIDFGEANYADARGCIESRNMSKWAPRESKLGGTQYFQSDIYTLGWCINEIIRQFKIDSPLISSLEFKRLLQDMTLSDYKYRPKIDECIKRMSEILEQRQRPQRNML